MNRIFRQATAFSKVSVNGRILIPRGVCERLKLKPGDTLRYRVSGGGIPLDKAIEVGDPFAVFSEWASEADERV